MNEVLPKVKDFVVWALTHADLKTIPLKATLPAARDKCGIEPWHYLFGTIAALTTKATIEERWKNHYSKSWTREAYDNATAGFYPNDRATDCQGLLDAYCTLVLGQKTDINAQMNYRDWCDEKGRIDEIKRSWRIGEAVFMQNTSSKKMTHIGWICGFGKDGAPLVVEARGIWYGVVVTKLADRPWSHRGIMSKKFEYEPMNEDQFADCLPFADATPMYRGEAYRAMQKALNLARYTDYEDKPLEEDGKWGKRSQSALEKFMLLNDKNARRTDH